jgi:acyl carrier protein
MRLSNGRLKEPIWLEFTSSITTLFVATMDLTPSQAEILREIQLMMKELFELDEKKVQPSARLIDDLELDSLDALDLAVKVEETTGLAIDEQKLRELRTVEDVIVTIDKLLGPDGIAKLRAARDAAAAQNS